MGDSLGRDEARRRKGRQVTRGEVVRTGAPSAMRRPAGRFGPSARTARRSRALHLGQVKGPMRHPAYQVVASVRLKVPWVSHGEQYTIDSVTPPLLLHQWGLTLARRKRQGRTKRIASLKIREKSGEGGTSDFLVRQPWQRPRAVRGRSSGGGRPSRGKPPSQSSWPARADAPRS